MGQCANHFNIKYTVFNMAIFGIIVCSGEIFSFQDKISLYNHHDLTVSICMTMFG